MEQEETIETKEKPVEQYKEAYHKRRTRSVIVMVCIIVEVVAACAISWNFKTEDLYTRINQEREIQQNGEVVLDTGTYSGETDFGYFSGQGEFSFNTGSTYTGEWTENKINGLGALNIPKEGTYKGEFVDSKKNGTGTFEWNDGDAYSGHWVNDQMSGKGEYTSSDGVVYSGSFDENTFIAGECKYENETGSYLLTYKNGEIKDANIEYADGAHYEGECDEHGLSGTGDMSYANGERYIGNYQDGARNDSGKYKWTSGDVYEGQWKNDNMSGGGIYKYKDGSYLDGTFKDNIFENGSYYTKTEIGEYTFTIKNKKAVSVKMYLEDGTTCEGDIQNGILSGKAQISYGNGDAYDGEISEGKKSGQGVYEWKSGASYDGQWENDLMSGQGTYYYSPEEDGYQLTGTFKNGKPDGSCNYYVSSSEYYKTDWSSGKCVKVYE